VKKVTAQYLDRLKTAMMIPAIRFSSLVLFSFMLDLFFSMKNIADLYGKRVGHAEIRGRINQPITWSFVPNMILSLYDWKSWLKIELKKAIR
jgi:hypothetical protein